jgi:glucosyl-dolichyl phosphate glucuronosyltransferase
MLLSVAICTRDRARSLDRTLDSLTRMRVPGGVDWELVVVNNGSSDATDSVIEKYAGRLPIHREFEARPGASHARNRAVDAARGEYILWTDDDVTVDEGWFAAYVAAFERWPEAALFGGKIIPVFEAPLSGWLKKAWPHPVIANTFAFRDFGDEPFAFTPQAQGSQEQRIPYGANFAVRTSQQKSQRYNPELGPTPGPTWVPGEETEVIKAILLSGRNGYWVPEAKVLHWQPVQRMTFDYVWRFYLRQGRFYAWVDQGSTAARLFRAPLWLWRRTIIGEFRYRLRRLLSGPAAWLPLLKEQAINRGTLDYWRNARR